MRMINAALVLACAFAVSGCFTARAQHELVTSSAPNGTRARVVETGGPVTGEDCESVLLAFPLPPGMSMTADAGEAIEDALATAGDYNAVADAEFEHVQKVWILGRTHCITVNGVAARTGR